MALALIRQAITIYSLIFIFNVSYSKSQSAPPSIEIDSKGHSGKIYNLSYTADGSQLISVSEDKSIRVWNTVTGELIKKYVSEISDGYGGTFYTSSISPDGKLLAVAGYPVESQKENYILIIDLEEGKQVGTAVGHFNVIQSLDFSGNGRYLASGGDDGYIIIWELETNEGGMDLTKVSTINMGTPVSSVSFNKKSQDLIVGAESGIFIYDLSVIHENGDSFPNKKLSKYKGIVNKVSCSPDGKYIAASTFEKEVLLWQNDGSFITALDEQEGIVNALSFSYDSRILVTMDIAGKGISYTLPNASKIASFDAHDNTVFAAAFSPKSLEGNYMIATAGGNNHEIYMWNAISGQSKLSIKSKGNTIWGLAFGKELELHISTDQRKDKTYSQSFDFKSFQLHAEPISESGKQISSVPKMKVYQKDLYSLDIERGGTIVNDPRVDGRILAFTSSINNELIVASDLSLKMYNRDGNLKKIFKGHKGSVRSVSVSADGRYLASGSEDQSVILWKLDEEGVLPSIREVFDDPIWQEYFESLPFDSLTYITNTSAWQETINLMKDAKDRNWKDLNEVYEQLGAVAEPFLNLFISADKEWVCWAPKGYFSCSSDGSRYFGWHINRGINTLADFYIAEQYFDILYRPEILWKSIAKGERVEDILRAEGDEIFDLTKLNRPSAIFFELTKSQIDSAGLDYQRGTYVSESPTLSLGVTYYDGGGGVKEINIYQNEKLIILDKEVESIGEGRKEKKSYEVNLSPGLNNFTVVVKNYQNTESREDKLKISYDGVMEASSNLHIISIGINKYKNSKYNLNYAFSDAQTFTSTIQKNTSSLFKSVNLVEIYDYEATKDNIVSAFDAVSKKAGIQDVFIFYYAGHGIIDEENESEYFLVPTDVTSIYGDSKQLQQKGVSASDLKLLLSKVKAQKQLILMDACHSGGAVAAITTRAVASEEKALFQLARASGVVMVASSGSKQFSTEFESLGHGVFTYALLEALDGKADQGDDKITVNEIKLYLEERVPFLSNEYGGKAQYPTGFVHGNDFPIGIVTR
ncbi:WD domain-containing protein, G-beta repeat-containing protein [Marivirga sericea]|uniref:WD domain-containing protein, G-beta repeat-containing protein n=1 Tax=Marivirga sericea TaxID=1028 RepID=A0A1X7I632_9BACT|nr:caspase family protein [Marivirga sericea]SMG09946.1 WD domain-containing protein, G-beta repeat-containing protein [Marivirga sericea]